MPRLNTSTPMRSLLCLLLVLGRPQSCSALGLLARLGQVPASTLHPGVANCSKRWHSQPLDHFDFSEQRIWKQRYFVYDRYWSPGGPTLFYCGNEASVELYVNATGLMWERAAELGARLVFGEHRYYGESQPLGAASTANSSNLRWLTMEQALADYASLIYALRADGPTSAVVALGGSYGGMLAAWLRMHYPSAVAGAISASAPVLAFDGLNGSRSQWNGNAYWQVVTADATVKHGGAAPGCVDGVRATWPALFARGRTADGRAWLSKTFRLCGGSLQSSADVARLAAWVLNVWDTLAMGNFPYASNYLVFQQTQDPGVTLPPWPFRAACARFTGASASTPADTLLERMAEAIGIFYNASRQEQCYTVPSDPNYDGIWDYQWCTERLPQETYFSIDGKHDMFFTRLANATAVAAHCMRKYGVASKGDWVAESSAFGAATAASNIIFSNGEYDPWRSGGVLSDLSPTIKAIQVGQGAHHLDLFFSNPADPPSVKAVREAEVAAIKLWIAQASAQAHAA